MCGEAWDLAGFGRALTEMDERHNLANSVVGLR